MIAALDKSGIKSFLILNDLTDEQKETAGKPREKYSNWIGTLIPDNVDAGYQIAKPLLKEAVAIHGDNIQILAVSGSRETPASVLREEGLAKALAEFDSVELLQIVYGEWEEEIAYETTLGLIYRYPEIKAVWNANDLMAEGAVRAIEEYGLNPGEDVFVSGLNWSLPAIDYILEGKMVNTVGGHFMVGGWSLVLLNDYHHGEDFADSAGTEVGVDIFGSIDITNVDEFMEHFGDYNWDIIDFKMFSKVLNHEIEKYDFSLQQILKQFEQ